MDIQAKLEKLGLVHWIKGEYDRIYINRCNLKDVFDVELEYYKTGNIKSCKIAGEYISNSKARGYFGYGWKIFFDCKTKKFNVDLDCVL